MKIFHLIVTLDRGGAENHLADLAIQQKRNGHQVIVAFLKGSGMLAADLSHEGIEVVNLRMKYYGDLGALARLVRTINKYTPNIAHAHLPGAEVYLILAKAFANRTPQTRWIATRHNDAPFGQSFLFDKLERAISKRLDHIIFISKAVRSQFIEQRRTVAERKGSLIYYGIDSKKFVVDDLGVRSALRTKWHVNDASLVFLSISRLVPQKRIDVLLHSYAQAQRILYPLESNLIIVGTGPLESEMIDLSKRLGIYSSVRWLGLRSDVPQLLAASDCLVLTSSYEGLGLVLLEAAAACRPVIASKTSAIPEIVEENITGLLIGPEDISGFSEAMVKMKNPELRAALGTKGQALVNQRFSNVACYQNTMDLYSQLQREVRT